MQPLRSLCTDRRAQSYTIGTILIIAMASAATIATATTGFIFLGESQDLTRIEAATQSMSELDSQASIVALDDNTNSKTIKLGFSNNEDISVKNTGRIKIEAINETDGTVEQVIVDKQIGTVVYSQQGTQNTVAYQGGGVWRGYGNEATRMVSPPEIHYRGSTLTMPLMVISSPSSQTTSGVDSVTATKVSSTAKFPTNTKKNPIEEGQIRITVTSDYYRGWGEFFENRMNGGVTVTPEEKNAAIMLEPPKDSKTITNGLSSTYSGSEVTIRGGGGSASFIDSYNSTQGDYGTSQSDNGNITANGDITLRGGANIYGNAIVPNGYSVSAQGSSQITGDVYNDDVPTTDVSQRVRNQYDGIKANNDNGDTAEITGKQLDSGQTTWELGAGDYYIDGNLDIGSGETLVLNTSDGPVNLGVSGDVQSSGGTIKVRSSPSNDEAARVYMLGDKISMADATVDVPEDRSSRFWIYAQPGLDADIRSDTRFVGVIYAPGDGNSGGVINLQSHASVFGGVVGGESRMRSGASIHYDQALKQQQVFEESTIPKVTYLHVSVNTVEIANDAG